MSSKTSFDDLYKRLCTLTKTVTGYDTWRKSGIQSQPSGPYALVYLIGGPSSAVDVVETVELESLGPNGETLSEVAWGTTHLEAWVEFFRGNALSAATRFRNTLQYEARFSDLYQVAGLTGEIRIIDISATFRADSENRVRVVFNLYANVVDDGSGVHEIDTQGVGVILQPQDVLVTKTITRGGG